MVLTSSNQFVGLAGNVQHPSRIRISAHTQPFPSAMNREFQTRFIAGFLFLWTTIAIILAWINFRKESQFVPPYDGVWWLERNGNLIADRVDSNGPGARAGVKPGDRLLSVDGRPVSTAAAVNSQLYHDGVWTKATYGLLR